MAIRKYVMGLLEQYVAMKREIAVLEYEVNHLDLSSQDDLIEAMTHAGSTYDERISGGGIANPTPQIALSYEKRFDDLRSEAILRAKGRINKLKEITQRLEHQIDQLESHHAAILRNYYFEGYSWAELSALMCISKSTLLKQKESALSCLCEMYKVLHQMGLIDLGPK